MDVVAQHGLQGLVQQVGGGVGPQDGLAALHVDGGGHGVAHLQAALGELAVVHELAALVLLHVGDVEGHAVGGDGAVVGHLAAHLGVEGGRVQHHDGLHAGDDLVHQLVLRHDGDHFRAGRSRSCHSRRRRWRGCPCRTPRRPSPGRPGPRGPSGRGRFCSSISLVEGVAVQGHALVLRPSPRSGRWGSRRCHTA